MLHIGQQVGRGRAFRHLALPDDRDAVRHVGDDGQIMGDHQHAHPVFGHQPFQQIKDLRLRGDVERGCRFIRDQEPWAQRDGHGDHHALALAA